MWLCDILWHCGVDNGDADIVVTGDDHDDDDNDDDSGSGDDGSSGISSHNKYGDGHEDADNVDDDDGDKDYDDCTTCLKPVLHL